MGKERMKVPHRSMQVNDLVRLIRGWTPMTIIGIETNGMVHARYGLYPTDEEFNNPKAFADYSRPLSGFTFWDGEDFPDRRNLPVARRSFTVKTNPSLGIGTLLNYTSGGFLALEFSNGDISPYSEDELDEIKPFIFSVRYWNGSSSTFTFEDPKLRVNVGDVLVDDNNSQFCIVREINQNANRPKAFKGRKVVIEDI